MACFKFRNYPYRNCWAVLTFHGRSSRLPVYFLVFHLLSRPASGLPMSRPACLSLSQGLSDSGLLRLHVLSVFLCVPSKQLMGPETSLKTRGGGHMEGHLPPARPPSFPCVCSSHCASGPYQLLCIFLSQPFGGPNCYFKLADQHIFP